MLRHLAIPLAWSLHPTWLVPVVGIATTAFAYWLGRLLLASQLTPPPSESAPDLALSGVTKDRRASARRQGGGVAVHLSLADHSLHPGRVQDRSIGGLCLLVEQPFPEGTVLEVKPCKNADALPWTPIIVKTCLEKRGEWELRCQFAKTPPYNILLLFG